MNKRLFCGVFPTGVSWSDRLTERDGDYKPLAFLPFSTLVLEVQKGCPTDLRTEIVAHAKYWQDRRGERYSVDACGHTVITLGKVCPPIWDAE